MLAEADATQAEDAALAEDRRGEELPEEVARHARGLQKLRQAKEAIEREAKERAEAAARERPEAATKPEVEVDRAGAERRSGRSPRPPPSETSPTPRPG